MPMYAYKGIGPTGKAVAGVRDADTPKGLRQLLRKDGVVVTSFELSKAGAKGARVLPPGTVLQAVGCPTCLEAGYRGRTGVYELLMLDDDTRRLTLEKADAGSIRKAALERGMVTLRFDGARKVLQGMTTPEEVMMVTAEAS